METKEHYFGTKSTEFSRSLAGRFVLLAPAYRGALELQVRGTSKMSTDSKPALKEVLFNSLEGTCLSQTKGAEKSGLMGMAAI